MAKKKASTKSKTHRFEDALAELENVVAELEAGQLSLTDSIQRYEKGVKLLKHCHESLNQVQRKIERLTGVDQDGNETTEPFDAEQTPADQPARGKPETGADMDESGRLF